MTARATITAALSLVAIMTVKPTETAQQIPESWSNQRDGDALPVTIQNEDGTYSEWRWNYHQGAYYRSNQGQTNPEPDTDYSFGWSMYDPAPADYWSW